MEKTTKKVAKKVSAMKKSKVDVSVKKKVTNKNCGDRLCPRHGESKLKIRGRIFQGKVIRKNLMRVTIIFERMIKVPKYERYEKRKTKLHARLPDCLKDEIEVGDLIQIEETRPISKTIHFIVSKNIKQGEIRK